MLIQIAVKPKYPTRKATDTILYNEDTLLTLVNIHSKTQLSALFATSYIAIVYNNKFYPIDENNYIEQCDLVDAGAAPTVDKDENFGIRKLNCFVYAPEYTEAIAKFQTNGSFNNGCISIKLFKVNYFNSIGITNIDKNGYWMAFNFDKEKAETEGYSNIKVNDQVLNAGCNYLFVGLDAIDISKFMFTIKAVFAEESVSEAFKLYIQSENLDTKADINAIEVNGKKCNNLEDAFAAVENKGEIIINKSFEDSSSSSIIKIIDKQITLRLLNNVTVVLPHVIEVQENGTLILKGNGTIKEKTFARAPIVLKNNNKDAEANLIVSENITLSGFMGVFISSNTHNCTIVSDGILIGNNNGTDDGAGLYVNGTAKSANIRVSGNISAPGHGIYQAGEAVTDIMNANISGDVSGVEIRAGSMNITNSYIISHSDAEPTMVSNKNGTCSTAVGLAIAQHTTKKEINVVVNDSTIIGKASIMEGNPEQVATATDTTHINIMSGAFNGIVKTLVPKNDCKNFLFGGTYSAKPDNMFIAEGFKVAPQQIGYKVVPMNDDDYFLKSLNLHLVDGEEFLYDADCPACDYDADNKYLEEHPLLKIPRSCSSLQVGQLRGRHYDWFYNNDAIIHINTPAGNGRYAVQGCTSGIGGALVKSKIDSGEYMDIYRHMAGCIIDGQNSEKLCVNTNVVPTGDVPNSGHTKLGFRKICNLEMTRYILDNAATVDEAIALFNEVDIWPPQILWHTIELHWHISDASGKSVIVEIINDKISVKENQYIMTNYFNTIDMTPHSNGIERYNILQENMGDVTDVASMLNVMKKVHYSNAYKDTTDPYWYSEMNAKDSFGDLTIDSPIEAYAEKKAYMQEQFAHRSRDTAETWHTVYEQVYDNANLTLTIIAEEGEVKHTFTLKQ